MTPAEKAQALYDSFLPFAQKWDDFKAISSKKENAKQCALIAIDEMLNEYETKGTMADWVDYRIAYWQQVKQEIEKL